MIISKNDWQWYKNSWNSHFGLTETWRNPNFDSSTLIFDQSRITNGRTPEIIHSYDYFGGPKFRRPKDLRSYKGFDREKKRAILTKNKSNRWLKNSIFIRFGIK